MNFLGNDIMSLQDNQNRLSFSRDRYLSKAFTYKEINLIRGCHTRSFLPYLIWTCKESAYKAMVKIGLRDTFCPAEFEMDTVKLTEQLLNPVQEQGIESPESNKIVGTIAYQQNLLNTESCLHTEYIHSIATTGEISSQDVTRHVEKIDSEDVYCQGALSRESLRRSLSKEMQISIHRIDIGKNKRLGIPYVYIDQMATNIDVSISHDLNYISFAYL